MRRLRQRDRHFGASARDGGSRLHRIAAVSGRAGRLPQGQQGRLRRIAAGARGALPLVIGPDETLSCPILAQDGSVTARALGMVRLQAALGAFADEAAFWRVAKSGTGS